MLAGGSFKTAKRTGPHVSTGLTCVCKSHLARVSQRFVLFVYLLPLTVQAVFGMCSHRGQQAEDALQRVAVTGRKQEYQELEGALLV